MMNRARMKGFTLLETMLVVAIMGIMATFAIPMFQDYMVRARVAEGLQLAMPARVAVAEYYMSHHDLANAQSIGYTSPAPTTNVASISIADKGQVIITYTKIAGDGTLILVPQVKEDGQMSWSCSKRARYNKNIYRAFAGTER